MMPGHDLKVVWREMVRYKISSIISIAGIAIGFVAFVFSDYWWHWETHFDMFHSGAERIYTITTEGIFKTSADKAGELNQVPKEDILYFEKALPEVERFCYADHSYYWLAEEGQRRQGTELITDTNFFAIFCADFMTGGYQGVPLDGNSVVLTESYARELFGKVNCVGEVFNVSGWRNVEIKRVAGVIRDYPDNTNLLFDMIVLGIPEYKAGRKTVYLLLKEQADVDAVKKKIEGHKSLATPMFGGSSQNWRFRLRSLPDLHFCQNEAWSHRFRNIRILMIAGWLALISALMNHVVLFAGRQQRKNRKNLTYAVLGESKREVMCRGLIELMLPVFLAFLLALGLVELLFPWYQEYTALEYSGIYSGIMSQIGQNGLLVRCLYYMVLSVLVFGGICFFPVYLFMYRWRLLSMQGMARRMRSLLIVGQIFIGSLLLLASLGMFKQLQFVRNVDKGIHLENIVQIHLGTKTAYQNDLYPLKQDLLQNPLIIDVAMTTSEVLSKQGEWYGSHLRFIGLPGRKNDGESYDIILLVDKNFLSFFGICLKEGRLPNEGCADELLVNETGARSLGIIDLQEAVFPGQSGGNGIVTGIVKDFHYCPMRYPIQGVFLEIGFPANDKDSRQKSGSYTHIYVKFLSENRERAMEYIRQCVARYDTGETTDTEKYVDMQAMEEQFNRSDETVFEVFMLLALICILISSFGIYSLVHLSMEQRKKEIAIRKVNGATIGGIFRIFVREYLALLLWGNLLAAVTGYWILNRWLETYAYHTSLGGWMFVFVFVFTSLIVVYSVFRQVSKIIRNNSTETLKES